MGNFLRQLNQKHGNSWTQDLQLWSMHETKLDPLHMGHSCVVVSVCGVPSNRTRIYPCYVTGILESIYCTKMPCSALMQTRGGLVLTQLNVPGFVLVDSSWEALPFLKKLIRVNCGWYVK